MKVFVAVPCSENARQHQFYASLASQRLPEGVTISAPVPVMGTYIPNNQNILAREFLKTDFDFFWLANDDQLYPPDTLAKLLNLEADIAVPLCPGKAAPFAPLLYARSGPGIGQLFLSPSTDRVIKVAAAGGGGMLIRRKVLQSIADPWWETPTVWENGRPRLMTEDIDFCRKAASAGFTILCDTEAVVGHYAPFAISIARAPDGSWTTVLERHGATVGIDQPTAASTAAPEQTRREETAASSV